VLTDSTGHASTQFTLGPNEGAQTVTASVGGGASVTFTAMATVARTLAIVSGDGQAAAPGAVLPAPLVVHAQDNGADVGGVGINWTLTGPAAVTPSGATSSAGLASATVTMGATSGAVSIRAERADDPTVFVVFSANTAQIQDIPGLTPEERGIAIVIDETCATLAGMASLTPAQQDFLARCQELTGGSVIDPVAVTDALDELLPGLALAMQEAAFNAAQAQFQNLKARIAALRSGTQGSSFQGLALQNSSGTVSLGSLGAALAGDGDEPAAPSSGNGSDFQRWGFFASGTIGRGEAEAGSTRPAYDYDINGLTVGLDYRYSDRFIFGGALGYTRQDSELRDQPGTMDMSGWSASGYATWYRDDSWYTDAVLTYGHNSFDLLRSISYTVPLPGGGSSSVDQTARSTSDGDLLEAALTFGHDFQAGGWSIGPYGRLLYTKLEFDRIVDAMDPGAGSGLGLEIDARSLTSVASEIGAKFTYAHSTDWGVVTPHLQLEWEHEFKDDPRALTARFLADPNSTSFTLSGEDIDTDFFRMSLGLSIILQRGRSGFLIYERTVGRDGFFQDNLGFGVRIEF
jgi:outer membrane autotransporter protein